MPVNVRTTMAPIQVSESSFLPKTTAAVTRSTGTFATLLVNEVTIPIIETSRKTTVWKTTHSQWKYSETPAKISSTQWWRVDSSKTIEIPRSATGWSYSKTTEENRLETLLESAILAAWSIEKENYCLQGCWRRTRRFTRISTWCSTNPNTSETNSAWSRY